MPIWARVYPSLDFIGNYRNAHYKLPFLAGQDLAQNPEPAKALRAIEQWATAGIRPDGVPDGVTIEIEPVALVTLRESLRVATPLRQLVLNDLVQLRNRLGRMPSVSEWQRQGRYSLATARTAPVEENKVGTNVSIKVELSNFCYHQLPQIPLTVRAIAIRVPEMAVK